MIEDIKNSIAQLAMDIEGLLNDASERAETLKEQIDILLRTSWVDAERSIPCYPCKTKLFLIRTIDNKGKEEISVCWWKNTVWSRPDIRKGLVKVVEFCKIPE